MGLLALIACTGAAFTLKGQGFKDELKKAKEQGGARSFFLQAFEAALYLIVGFCGLVVIVKLFYS